MYKNSIKMLALLLVFSFILNTHIGTYTSKEGNYVKMRLGDSAYAAMSETEQSACKEDITEEDLPVNQEKAGMSLSIYGYSMPGYHNVRETEKKLVPGENGNGHTIVPKSEYNLNWKDGRELSPGSAGDLPEKEEGEDLALPVIGTAAVYPDETTITEINVYASVDAIKLSWPSLPQVLGYEVEVDGVVVDNESETVFRHGGLLPGTTHTYRVRAKLEDVTSPWSNTIEQTTLDLTTYNQGLAIEKQYSTKIPANVNLVYLNGSMMTDARKNLTVALKKLAKKHGINGWCSAHDIDYAMDVIFRYDGYITELSEKYSVPKATISSVLFREIMCLTWNDQYLDELKEELLHNASLGISQNGVQRVKKSMYEITGISYTDDQIRRMLKDEKDNILFVAVYLTYVAKQQYITMPATKQEDIIQLFVRYNDNPEGKFAYGNQTYEYYEEFKEYYAIVDEYEVKIDDEN